MPGILGRLHQMEREFAQDLDKLLHNNNCIEEFLRLSEEELIWLVNYLNDTISRFAHIGLSSRKCLHVLQKICSAQRVLPADYDLHKTLSRSSDTPVAPGRSYAIFKGTIGTEVCIKEVQELSGDDPDAVKKLFCKEAVVWKHLNHPNVVAFKGITFNPLQLVSDLMPGGELQEYIKKNPNTNRIHLLLDVANGLAYLDSRDVIHGDLKGSSIMVDGSGNARITDFGLASIVQDSSSLTSTSGDRSFTPRWTAPEILKSGIPVRGKSDVFSFGMVIYEVFSGRVPFYDVQIPIISTHIMNGYRPKRPDHPKLTDALWELTKKCWAPRAQDRPEIVAVVKELEIMNSNPAGSSSSVDDPNEPPLLAPSHRSDSDGEGTPTTCPPAKRQIDQLGDQTSEHSGEQSDQSPVQGQANSTRAAALELPISVVAEKPGESNAPPQQESPTPLKPVPPKSEQLQPEPPMDPQSPSPHQLPEQSGCPFGWFCCCSCCNRSTDAEE